MFYQCSAKRKASDKDLPVLHLHFTVFSSVVSPFSSSSEAVEAESDEEPEVTEEKSDSER